MAGSCFMKVFEYVYRRGKYCPLRQWRIKYLRVCKFSYLKAARDTAIDGVLKIEFEKRNLLP